MAAVLLFSVNNKFSGYSRSSSGIGALAEHNFQFAKKQSMPRSGKSRAQIGLGKIYKRDTSSSRTNPPLREVSIFT